MANSQGHAVGRDAQPELDEKALETVARDRHEQQRKAHRAGLPWDEMSPDYRERHISGLAERVGAYLLAAGGTGERERREADDSVSHERRPADGTADPGAPQPPGSETDLTEDFIAHRLAAAILLGTATSKHPEYLTYAEESCDRVQPPRIAKATKALVADVRRYEEGTAATLEAELRAALASPSPVSPAGREDWPNLSDDELERRGKRLQDGGDVTTLGGNRGE